MDLSRCEGCNFENNENCYMFELCKMIEATENIASAKEKYSKPMVDWALKQA